MGVFKFDQRIRLALGNQNFLPTIHKFDRGKEQILSCFDSTTPTPKRSVTNKMLSFCDKYFPSSIIITVVVRDLLRGKTRTTTFFQWSLKVLILCWRDTNGNSRVFINSRYLNVIISLWCVSTRPLSTETTYQHG